MALRRQLCYALPIAIMLVLLSEASLTTIPAESAYANNNIYDNYLQREYPGPVAFPDHQVERKAQRSPSLRLRFGRRNDPDMELAPSVEKRWFGDVRQKPIRSPSLRLRFGRRNDPTMPIHSDLDILMNELSKNVDYNGIDFEYEEPEFERAARAPRLRWGRSISRDRDARSPLRLRFGRSAGNGEGNFPIPTIPPWILTAVAEQKNTPEITAAANKN